MKKVFLILLLYLCACTNSQPPLAIFTGTAMTIQYRILIGQSLSSSETEQIQQLITMTFDEVDQIYNKWNPHSELSSLNRLIAGVKTPISHELEQLLQLTNSIVQLTEGRFDPTIEPLQQLWKLHLEQGSIPSNQEIASIITGWNQIHFENGIFYKDSDYVQLDLGGIAKGYCVDLLTTRLNQAGFPHVFVEWGGEIRTSGLHPDNRLWNIFISRFGNCNSEDALAILSLNNQAIATSGDYLQCWEIKNTTYFHVIDPKTSHPCVMTEKSIASASVLAPTCAFADGLATALMTFSTVAEANQWINQIKEKYPELQFWIYSRKEKN